MPTKRKIRGLGPAFPLHAVNAQGESRLAGMLTALDAGFLWAPESGPALRFGHMPWFARTTAPEGFLGRLAAQAWSGKAWSGEIPVSPRLTDWGDDDFIVAAALRGEDMPGHFILGHESLSRWLEGIGTGGEGITPPVRARECYPDMAAALLRGEPAGSPAAGGEQPKFTCFSEDNRHVIVKFSPPLDAAAGRRWGDLLVCEDLAAKTIQEAGFAAAQCDALEQGGRMFLESARFDRQGIRGRNPMASLGVVDDEFFGYRDSWENAAARLAEAGKLAESDRDAVLWLSAFGRLICNTDRHFGNLSLGGFDTAGLRFSLLPAYDMLPMRLAPAHGEVSGRDVEFSDADCTQADTPIEASAAEAALRFWRSAAEDPRISPDFSILARETHRRLGDWMDNSRLGTRHGMA
jgi:hypothetical protein